MTATTQNGTKSRVRRCEQQCQGVRHAAPRSPTPPSATRPVQLTDIRLDPATKTRSIALGVLLALGALIASAGLFLAGSAVSAALGASERMLPVLSLLWTAGVLAFGLLTLRALGNRQRSMDLQSSQSLGPYTLGEKVGEGGMGVVFKATHSLLPRTAAIKLLRPQIADRRAKERFEREVKLTSLLTHPNTISVYDFGRAADGALFYAMEYVDGVDLQTLVEREGPQEPARVAHILAQVCGALAEAHGMGLVHRDIKPANIMICERGGIQDVVKVLDFGLTSNVGSTASVRDSREERTLVGTPLYLSPEALTDPELVDGRSDLYALGAVGYFLLTGEPPFRGRSVLEVCAHHLHTAPVPPSERGAADVPPELEQLILDCLEKAMDRRPRDAATLEGVLRAVASSAGAPRVRSVQSTSAMSIAS